MPVSVTSGYSGDALDRLIARLFVPLQAFNQGLFNIEADIKKTRAITRASLSNDTVQADAADPAFVGTLTLNERTLTPAAYVAVNMKLDPYALKDHWIAEKFKKGEPFVEWPVELQMQLMDLVNRNHWNWLNRKIWSGSTGGGDPFQGIITRLVADVATLDVPTPVALTSANILVELNELRDTMTDLIRLDPATRIIVSPKTLKLYQDADRALTYKGVNNADAGPSVFAGTPIVALHGFPDDTMLATAASVQAGGSNLFAGVGYDIDSQDTLIVDRVSNSSREWFVQIRARLDVNYAFAEECVLYKV